MSARTAAQPTGTVLKRILVGRAFSSAQLELIGQRCLADAGLAAEQVQRAPARCRGVERRHELLALTVPANQGPTSA